MSKKSEWKFRNSAIVTHKTLGAGFIVGQFKDEARYSGFYDVCFDVLPEGTRIRQYRGENVDVLTVHQDYLTAVPKETKPTKPKKSRLSLHDHPWAGHIGETVTNPKRGEGKVLTVSVHPELGFVAAIQIDGKKEIRKDEKIAGWNLTFKFPTAESQAAGEPEQVHPATAKAKMPTFYQISRSAGVRAAKAIARKLKVGEIVYLRENLLPVPVTDLSAASDGRIAVEIEPGIVELMFFDEVLFAKSYPHWTEKYKVPKEAASIPMKAFAEAAGADVGKLMTDLKNDPDVISAFAKDLERETASAIAETPLETMRRVYGLTVSTRVHVFSVKRSGTIVAASALRINGEEKDLGARVVLDGALPPGEVFLCTDLQRLDEREIVKFEDIHLLEGFEIDNATHVKVGNSTAIRCMIQGGSEPFAMLTTKNSKLDSSAKIRVKKSEQVIRISTGS